MKNTILESVIGSKTKPFLDKIKVGDELFLYSKSHVWAKLSVCSEGHEDNTRIWEDDIYPYRFGVEVLGLVRDPISLEKIGGNQLLRDKFGPQWGFKVLFTPNELPNDLVNLINQKFIEEDLVSMSEYSNFFENNLLFGLKGKKLEIEREKLSK